MSLTVASPYSNDLLPWWKGNLHTHTTNSDGKRPPQEVVDIYAARGYGFLMISDHDFLTPTDSVQARGMTLIPGNEVSANGPHILHVNAKSLVAPDTDRQKVIHGINADGGFAVVAHPNWQNRFAHCPQDYFETWEGYAGIEIYNGVIRRLQGSPLATNRWDMLLGQGRRVWGFAHDDSHRTGDDELAWNMVQGLECDVESVLEALREGRFYPSTGVRIQSIRVCGATIDIRTDNAERIVFLSDFARREHTVDAAAATFTVPEDAEYTYIRIECWGPRECMAWTQPLFLSRD